MNRDLLHFLLRRMHSLMGIVPLGVYLFEHFFTNSFSFQGPEAYNSKVDFLRSIPYLELVEWTAIFLPILFHTLYGFVIIWQGQNNVSRYGYGRNWMYLLQRISAFFVLGFLILHVGTLRFAYDPDQVDFFSVLAQMFQNPFMVAFYALGILAAVFHFCNGICTFCMTWGITVGPTSQRVAAAGATALGLAMAFFAIRSMFGFVHPEMEQAVAETAMLLF